jgi:hypothetical protein
LKIEIGTHGKVIGEHKRSSLAPKGGILPVLPFIVNHLSGFLFPFILARRVEYIPHWIDFK